MVVDDGILYASLYSAGFGQKRNIDCCTLDRSSTIHVCIELLIIEGDHGGIFF